MGFKLLATEGTAAALEDAGVKVEKVNKFKEGHPNIVDLIRDGQVDFGVKTLTHGRKPFSDGFHIPQGDAGGYSGREEKYSSTIPAGVFGGIVIDRHAVGEGGANELQTLGRTHGFAPTRFALPRFRYRFGF